MNRGVTRNKSGRAQAHRRMSSKVLILTVPVENLSATAWLTLSYAYAYEIAINLCTGFHLQFTEFDELLSLCKLGGAPWSSSNPYMELMLLYSLFLWSDCLHINSDINVSKYT